MIVQIEQEQREIFSLGSLCLRGAGAFVMVFCLIGCGNPFVSSLVRSKPATGELTGIWTIDTKRSRVPFSWGPQVGKAKLILHSNGKLKAIDLPGQVFNLAGGSKDVTGRGKWTISKHQNWWAVQLDWLNRNDVQERWIEDIYVRKTDSEYLLHYTLGDPDAGHAVVLTRQNDGKNREQRNEEGPQSEGP